MSSWNQGILVTIVSESVLQDRLLKLLTTLGVSGFTIVPVQGAAGSHGKRMGDTLGFNTYNTNIEIKTIVTAEVSEQLLTELKHFTETHAVIAFRQNVEGLFA